jgi:hypothetical protein
MREGRPAGAAHPQLVHPSIQRLLDATPELDYLTHIVFRMYENMAVSE